MLACGDGRGGGGSTGGGKRGGPVVKIRRQRTDYNETIIKHIFKPKMTEINKNILKPKMRDCNETIIKNIFKHWKSWVLFRTQWFIGQYCSEREGRGYRCRCTSFPFYDCILKTTEKETGFSVSKQAQAPK